MARGTEVERQREGERERGRQKKRGRDVEKKREGEREIIMRYHRNIFQSWEYLGNDSRSAFVTVKNLIVNTQLKGSHQSQEGEGDS